MLFNETACSPFPTLSVHSLTVSWQMTIGRRIRLAMKQADDGNGISQSELARRLNIAPQAVQGWVRDKDPVIPRQSRIASIARVLGVSEGYLYGTEPEKGEDMSPSLPAQQLLQRIVGAAPRLDQKALAVLKAYVDALLVMQEQNAEEEKREGKGKADR